MIPVTSIWSTPDPGLLRPAPSATRSEDTEVEIFMPRITLAEARKLWDEEMNLNNWDKRKIRRIMFEYSLERDRPTIYRPAPAWRTIADDTNTADLDAYKRLQKSLIEQADQRRGIGLAPR